MSSSLTARQQQVLDFLKAEIARGMAPTVRDVQAHFHFSSVNAAAGHLTALESKGRIRRLRNKARGIILLDAGQQNPVVQVPIFGIIPAGVPTDQQQEPDGHIAVDARAFSLSSSAQLFGLRVTGNSMVNAHILEGDFVVLEFREPRNGDVVAALVDGETTLKRYLVEKGQVLLRAENPDFPDIIPRADLFIQGVLLAVLRRGTPF